MTFNQWLDQKRGRVNLIADHFGITTGAVSQWRTNGVPKKKMLAVRDFTKRRVSLCGMLGSKHRNA